VPRRRNAFLRRPQDSEATKPKREARVAPRICAEVRTERSQGVTQDARIGRLASKASAVHREGRVRGHRSEEGDTRPCTAEPQARQDVLRVLKTGKSGDDIGRLLEDGKSHRRRRALPGLIKAASRHPETMQRVNGSGMAGEPSTLREVEACWCNHRRLPRPDCDPESDVPEAYLESRHVLLQQRYGVGGATNMTVVRKPYVSNIRSARSAGSRR
jgi:hypothetical protein